MNDAARWPLEHVVWLPHPLACVIRVPFEWGARTNDYAFGLNEIRGMLMDNVLVGYGPRPRDEGSLYLQFSSERAKAETDEAYCF